ncbi:MAG: hypothetical protein Q4G08_05940 [Capnocytophaga sp.]|nr:hypothetical protein [Capnocytophaga sp.]
MKNISAILLALCLLFSNSGLALTLHYCKENIQSVSLAFSAESKAESPVKECCQSDNGHKECCDDKSVETSAADSKAIVKTFDFSSVAVLSEAFCATFTPFIIVADNPKSSPATYAETHAPPLYKLYCQWVLYA